MSFHFRYTFIYFLTVNGIFSVYHIMGQSVTMSQHCLSVAFLLLVLTPCVVFSRFNNNNGSVQGDILQKVASSRRSRHLFPLYHLAYLPPCKRSLSLIMLEENLKYSYEQMQCSVSNYSLKNMNKLQFIKFT